MFNNSYFLLGISTLFAAIPVGIWLYILFSRGEKSKKTIALVFAIGCLTAPSLLGLQYLWELYPRFDLSKFVENTIETQTTMYIAMFILFAAMEEIIKHFVVSGIDKKTLLINKVNDAIRYSLAAALGFSFTENIYYLYEFWPSITTGELIQMYIFRSIFTACAHMIFSGIFGYYYGIGKFSIQITEQQKVLGKKQRITGLIANVFSIPMAHAFQQQMVLKGLSIAIIMHAFYNYMLQYNRILPALIFVVIGFSYLKYLLSTKAGHLILTTDITEIKKSRLAKKDEDIVLELLGMWFNDKRYVDVIHICERLLERDPDNQVIKLFKTKAMDRMDLKDTYRHILGSVIKSKEDFNKEDKSLIARYLLEKQKCEKNEKNSPKQIVQNPSNQNILPENSPETETFKVNL